MHTVAPCVRRDLLTKSKDLRLCSSTLRPGLPCRPPGLGNDGPVCTVPGPDSAVGGAGPDVCFAVRLRPVCAYAEKQEAPCPRESPCRATLHACMRLAGPDTRLGFASLACEIRYRPQPACAAKSAAKNRTENAIGQAASEPRSRRYHAIRKKNRKPCKRTLCRVLLLYSVFTSGEIGIRTPGAFQLNGFQDRRNRPLCHLSGYKSTMRFWFLQMHSLRMLFLSQTP